MKVYSRENGFACEYDNYTIPPYDPTMSDEERAIKQVEARKRVKDVLEQLKRNDNN